LTDHLGYYSGNNCACSRKSSRNEGNLYICVRKVNHLNFWITHRIILPNVVTDNFAADANAQTVSVNAIPDVWDWISAPIPLKPSKPPSKAVAQ
jgi:hypothetical protein